MQVCMSESRVFLSSHFTSAFAATDHEDRGCCDSCSRVTPIESAASHAPWLPQTLGCPQWLVSPGGPEELRGVQTSFVSVSRESHAAGERFRLQTDEDFQRKSLQWGPSRKDTMEASVRRWLMDVSVGLASQFSNPAYTHWAALAPGALHSLRGAGGRTQHAGPQIGFADDSVRGQR